MKKQQLSARRATGRRPGRPTDFGRANTRSLARLVAWAALFAPSSAFAYCRMMSCELGETQQEPCKKADDGICVAEGEPTHWPTPCLNYAIQLDGSRRSGLDADQLVPIFEEAFGSWKSADCGSGQHPHFDAKFQGFVSCDRQQAVCGDVEDNVNVFMFLDETWPNTLPPNVIAVTNPIGSVASGRLIDADIRFNSANFSFDSSVPGSLDVRRVVAHELGHFLGLAHSNERGALMSIDYHQISSAGAALTTDDQAAICAAFPPRPETLNCAQNGPATDACASDEIASGKPCKLPSGGGGCSAYGPFGASHHAPWTLVACAGALLVLGRRRRSGKSIVDSNGTSRQRVVEDSAIVW